MAQNLKWGPPRSFVNENLSTYKSHWNNRYYRLDDLLINRFVTSLLSGRRAALKSNAVSYNWRYFIIINSFQALKTNQF